MLMSIRSVKILTFSFWIVALFYIAYVVWANTNPINRNYQSPLYYFNFLQRASGLTVFLLLTDQIVTGAFMDKITIKFGGWFYRYHTLFGIIAYALILTHIFSYIVFLYIATRVFDPFYFFADICLICEPSGELFISLGRIAFWVITFTVLVAKFRTLPALRKNWKLIHIFNYAAFLLVAVHSYKTGSDTSSVLFSPIYFSCVIAVLVAIMYRIYTVARDNITLK
jgi:predicted ferric reductase